MTVSLVIDELKDLKGKARLDVMISNGLIISDPGKESINIVLEAAKKSGDRQVLSCTDINIIALAYEKKGVIFSDDFALQNTASFLSIPVHPIIQRKSQQKKWKLRCSGCGQYFQEIPHESICPVCGAQVKRKIK